MRQIGWVLLILVSLTAHAEDELSLSSEGFAANTLFPVLYACDGQNISPPLSWVNVPKGTESFALIVYDVTSPKSIYQWVVFNIPTVITTFDEGMTHVPQGAVVGKNSWGKTSYQGLCPPLGSIHTYSFSLYALNKKLNLTADANAYDVLNAMNDAIIQQADIKVGYSRWPWRE